MILDERQIETLKNIISKHLNAFLLATLGAEALSSEDLKQLQRSGLLKYILDGNLFAEAFKVGKKRKGPKSQLDKLDYKQFREHKFDEYLSAIDKQVIEQVKNSSEHYTKKLKDGITNKMLGKVLEANRESARNTLGSPIGPDASKRITKPVNIQKLARELQEQTKNSFVDWERVVSTELNAAYSQGAIHSILEDNLGNDTNEIMVYMEGPLDEGTCKWCRLFYHDGNSFKIYRLVELLANGTNVGKKKADWLAVIPPMHPRCRHRVVELPKGFSLDANGKIFFVDSDHHELDNPLIKKSLQYKVPTFSGWKLQDRYTYQGMKISVERKKGTYRYWEDRDGKKGKNLMHHDYGYIRNTLGSDGDHVDCYVGPEEDSKYVFIVHQLVPKTGKHDEEKVMLGFNTYTEAKAAYLKHYDSPKFFGGMTMMHIEKFKKKVLGKRTDIIKGAAHKYIKRTGSPGNYQYWYKLPNGKVVSSDDPVHADKNSIDKIESTHKPDLQLVVLNGKPTGNSFYETASGEKVFVDRDNNEYLVDIKTGEKINIDKHKPVKKLTVVARHKEKDKPAQPYEKLMGKTSGATGSLNTVGDYKRNLSYYGREHEIEGMSLKQIQQHKNEFHNNIENFKQQQLEAAQNLDPKTNSALMWWTSQPGPMDIDELREMSGEDIPAIINHYMIRDVQRGKTQGADPEQIKYCNQVAKQIEKDWDNLPRYEGAIFRGVQLEPDEIKAFHTNMKPGATFTIDAFSSFSRKKSIASGFGNYLLVVKNNTKGRDISFTGGYEEEEEILVKKGTKYKVVDAKLEDGSGIIYLEEVENGRK